VFSTWILNSAPQYVSLPGQAAAVSLITKIKPYQERSR
jgi:hypothetical protein